MSSVYRSKLLEYVADRMNSTIRTANDFKLAFRRFNECGIRTCDQLLAQFDQLTTSDRFVAVVAFSQFRFAKASPLLLKLLDSRSATLSGAAAGALSTIGGRLVMRELLRRLSTCRSYKQMAVIVSALAHMRRADHNACLSALMTVARAPTTAPDILSIAIDGIGEHASQLDRRTRAYKEAVGLVSSFLGRSEADLRCISAFAAGKMGATQLLPKLREMAACDLAVVVHSAALTEVVAEEASLAIEMIVSRRKQKAR